VIAVLCVKITAFTAPHRNHSIHSTTFTAQRCCDCGAVVWYLNSMDAVKITAFTAPQPQHSQHSDAVIAVLCGAVLWYGTSTQWML
jgi:uncharacterized protein with PIN domain